MRRSDNKIKNEPIKTWKEARPNEKLINCPTDDPILKLVGAILTVAYEDEGANYFSDTCRRHDNSYCGSFWTDVAGLDTGYIKRKAEEVYLEYGSKKNRKRKNKFKKERI